MSTDLTTSFVAVVGAPNSGKTTLYNWLTGSHYRTVNYPGATVEYSLGNLADRYLTESIKSFGVMDTPGTYSLFPKSADEEVTLRALYEHPKLGPAKKVLLVVDGTQLSRHLLIAQQLKEAGFSFVIAITMQDLLAKNGIQVDLQKLSQEFGTTVIPVDGLLGGGVKEVIEALHRLPEKTPQKLSPWDDQILTRKVAHSEQLAVDVLRGQKKQVAQIYDQTARLDRWLLHPIFGLLIFFLIMWGIFSAIYWGAAPLMDEVDGGFIALGEWVAGLGSETLWADFLANGVVASFGAVLVFVPQIFILFLGIGLLESSGYLARAATLIDRPFSKIGLSGRSFVPLLSGFACSVPAIMATRNIASKRDRWITNFIIPLMSCSARVPVYALLLSFVFLDEAPWKTGFAMACLYIGAMFVGAVAAAIVNKILEKNEKSFFMMELPLYRKPQWRVILHQTWHRTKAYVKRAGPVIFVFAVIIWVGTTFPNYQAEDDVKLETSYMAQAGKAVEPLFTPMGVDWRVGVGLISAFAAREVFVSSLATIFHVAGEDEDAQAEGLIQTMSEATLSNGQLIFTPATVVGLLIFFMIALQCMSTVGVQVRESGSWKFAVMQLIVFNVVAYVLAIAAVHGLRAFGVA